jgi:hypothetical protein
MAISKSWVKKIDGFGELTLNNAYCRITKFNGSKENISFTLSVENKEMNSVFDQRFYSFTPSMVGNNFIAQAYTYLKTLPEFADAEDC